MTTEIKIQVDAAHLVSVDPNQIHQASNFITSVIRRVVGDNYPSVEIFDPATGAPSSTAWYDTSIVDTINCISIQSPGAMMNILFGNGNETHDDHIEMAEIVFTLDIKDDDDDGAS